MKKSDVVTIVQKQLAFYESFQALAREYHAGCYRAGWFELHESAQLRYMDGPLREIQGGPTSRKVCRSSRGRVQHHGRKTKCNLAEIKHLEKGFTEDSDLAGQDSITLAITAITNIVNPSPRSDSKAWDTARNKCWYLLRVGQKRHSIVTS